jgi:hypothetical protein
MTETARICTMGAVDPQAYSAIARSLPLVRPGKEAKLWEPQAQALGALAWHGGVVAQLGCGDGKGLVSMLGPRVINAQRPLVLIPSKLRDTYQKEFRKFDDLGFCMPQHLEMRSHTYISNDSTFLERYQPDYLAIDESQYFRRYESSRTERLLRFLNDNRTRSRGGQTAFCILSGTMVATSILDAAHLMTHAVGAGCPTPRHPNPRSGMSRELACWANCLDPDGRPSALDWQALAPLVQHWAPEYYNHYCTGHSKTRREIARRAYSARRRCSPGVVVSDAESCGVPLEITIHTQPRPGAQLAQLYAYAAGGQDPLTGDPFIDAVARWRALQQLSTGCYYRWNWARVGRTSPDERWLALRSQWHRALARERRLFSAPNYDSPRYIEDAIKADNGHHLRPVWERWQSQKKKYKIADLREIITVDYEYLRAVVSRAYATGEPTIIWWSSEGAERGLRALGVPCYGAGTVAPSTPMTCGLSLDCHGTGVNLQDRWARMVFAEFPSSGEAAEQAIARLHRPGQRAGVVRVELWCHTPAFRKNLSTARNRAEFIDWAQGRQRLNYATIKEI